MKSVLIVPYFGVLPEWWDLFEESLNYNPNFTWYLFTDIDVEATSPQLKVFRTTFEDYCASISTLLGIKFAPDNAYKLCDARPVFGHLHENLIKEFDFYGFCDIDLIFGDIESCLPENYEKFNVISMRDQHLSGHFSLFKNTVKNRRSYTRIKSLSTLLEDPRHRGVDENAYSRIFYRHKRKPAWLRGILSLFDSYLRGNYFREMYTTPSPLKSPKMSWWDGKKTHPKTWYWKDGKITNERDGDVQFIYMHFMAYRNARYSNSSEQAPWASKDHVLHVSTIEAKKEGFKITVNGFESLGGGY